MDAELRDAIRRLTGYGDFRQYVEYLTRRRDEAARLGMLELDDSAVRRYQGVYSALDALLADIKRATETPQPRPQPRQIV